MGKEIIYTIFFSLFWSLFPASMEVGMRNNITVKALAAVLHTL